MNTIAEFIAHPLGERGRWTEVGSPAGPVRALLPPATFAGMTPRMDPIPAVGEHTDAILSALGMSEGEISALRSAGAI